MIKLIKKVLPYILTFIISIAIALSIGEVAIRLLFPQVTSPVQFFYDEKLGGVVAVPNQKGFKKFPGVYYYEYQNNDIGMRDTRNVADYEKYARRILCIGDSFTYGWGVNDNETFSHILEKKINNDSVAVLNAGTSGTGTDYALKFMQVRGQELKPSTVLYFYFDNDRSDNMANAFFHIENDSIITNSANEVTKANGIRKNNLANHKLYNWLSAHSQLFGLIRYNVGLMWNKRVIEMNKDKAEPQTEQTAKTVSQPSVSKADTIVKTDIVRHDLAKAMMETDSMYHTFKYLYALDKEVKKQGSEFMIYFIPSEVMLKEHNASGSIKVEGMLREYCSRNQIKFLSFTDEILRAKDPLSFYIPIDQHWNSKGHAMAGEYLYKTLKQEGIVP